jgi:hypothetical protein
MVVGLESDQHAERREHQRDRHHQRNQQGRDAEFDNHHAVERTVQQHDGDASRDLEQRQPQQPSERELFGGSVRKGKKTRSKTHPALCKCR